MKLYSENSEEPGNIGCILDSQRLSWQPVADFPDLHINLVFLGLLNPNPNLNLETGNLPYRRFGSGLLAACFNFSI
jgi:hypothetical protein